MSKFSKNCVLIFIVTILIFACSGCKNSALIDKVLFKQKNDVHSLIANMYNALKNDNIQDLNKEHDWVGYKNLRKENGILEEIRSNIKPEDFILPRITIEPNNNNGRSYYVNDKQISKSRADILWFEIKERVSEEVGLYRFMSSDDYDENSEEDKKRAVELKKEVERVMLLDPNLPIDFPIIDYSVKMIFNEKHHVSFSIKDNGKSVGYSDLLRYDKYE